MQFSDQVYKEAVRRMEEEGQDTGALVMDLAPVYSLGPAWPPLEMTAADEEDIIERLKAYLEKRLATRRALLEDHENKEMKFRDLLLNMVLVDERNANVATVPSTSAINPTTAQACRARGLDAVFDRSTTKTTPPITAPIQSMWMAVRPSV